MMTHICCKCGEFIYPGQDFKRSGEKKTHRSPACERAKVQVASEPAPLPGDGARVHGHALPRLISSRVARSEVDRHCYYCDGYMESWIFAGEEYVREVWVVPVGEFWEGRTRIDVRFRHSPECPMPFDDPEEGRGQAKVFEMKKKTKPASVRSHLRRAA